MVRILRVVRFAFVLALVVVALWAVVRGTLEEPSIVGSLATVAGAVAIVAYQQRGQRQDAVKEARREQLADLYEDLTRLIRSLPKAPTKEHQRKTEKTLGDFQDKLLIWGPGP